MFYGNPIDQVTERSLAVAARCVAFENSPSAVAFMQAQFEEIALEIEHWGLSEDDKDDLIRRPMELEFADRFGIFDGGMIYQDFLEAFRSDLGSMDSRRGLDFSQGGATGGRSSYIS